MYKKFCIRKNLSSRKNSIINLVSKKIFQFGIRSLVSEKIFKVGKVVTMKNQVSGKILQVGKII